ncbi:MAG: histidine phosphatase family protein, partial [Sphingomonadaceae bacterium]
MAGQSWDAVWSSDLARARETADLVAGNQERVRPTAALRELHFGVFEGLTAAEIQARFPDAAAAWWSDTLGARPPGGESLADLDARLEGWWRSMREEWAGPGDVLVVAHGGSLNRLAG